MHSKRVDCVYPDHANDLHEAGLATSIFSTIRELWKDRDEKIDHDKENDPPTEKRKTEMSIFALSTHVIFLFPSTGWSTY